MFPTKIKTLIGALCACITSATAHSAVQYSDNNTPVTITPVGFAQGYPANSFIIEHDSSSSFGQATIWVTNGESLGRIICDNSATGQLLIIEIGLGDGSPNTWPNNIQSIEIDEDTFPGFRPVIVSRLNMHGNLGELSAHRLLDAHIGGDINGNMIFPLPFDGINEQTGGRAIDSVVIEGNVNGSIEVEAQNIVDLTVKGRFGAPNSPQHIYLSGARWLINSRFSEFHGEISTPLGAPIYAVDDVSFTKEFGGTGAFSGEIKAYRLDVYPNEPGHLDFQGPMSGVFRLSIGLYTGFGSIALPGNAQFSGQVIINDTNTEPWWTGPVTIGGTPIARFYPDLPATLGGGSIGIVPFNLHDEACSPTPGQTFSAHGAPESFTLRHYGPVDFSGSTPVYIERKPIGCGAFTPVAGPISATPHPGDPNSILVSAGDWLEDGYAYRISPKTAGASMLRSIAHAAKTTATVRPWTYEFTARCDADADGSGFVDVNDISFVLFRLGQGGCEMEGDVDFSQSIDVNDISYILFRLGNDCSGSIPAD